MNLRCITTLRGLIRSGDPLDDRLRGLMDKNQPNDISSVFPLLKLLKEYQKLDARCVGLSRNADRDRHKEKLSKSAHFKASFRFVRGAVSAPLFALARVVVGPLAQPVGSITTDPSEVDSIVQHAYGRIYAGNFIDEEVGVASFMHTYDEHLFKSAEFVVQPIDAQELMDTCTASKPSAGGMDGVSPEDLTILPYIFFVHFAFLLNAIEHGKAWPAGMLHGRTAFLQKDPSTQTFDPLDFRVLLILSVFYRKWAAHRLWCLRDWISLWDIPELNAGVPGKGAEDA